MSAYIAAVLFGGPLALAHVVKDASGKIVAAFAFDAPYAAEDAAALAADLCASARRVASIEFAYLRPKHAASLIESAESGPPLAMVGPFYAPVRRRWQAPIFRAVPFRPILGGVRVEREHDRGWKRAGRRGARVRA